MTRDPRGEVFIRVITTDPPSPHGPNLAAGDEGWNDLPALLPPTRRSSVSRSPGTAGAEVGPAQMPMLGHGYQAG